MINSNCCAHCWDLDRRLKIEAGVNPGFPGTIMYVCNQCGNKRCPKATYHGYMCSGSNELNQIGVLENYG